MANKKEQLQKALKERTSDNSSSEVNEFDLMLTQHKNNLEQVKKVSNIPNRKNYCIRLQEDIYNDFFNVIEKKFTPSERAHKRSEVIEDLLLSYIKKNK